jgi:hypothetical protein
VPSIQAGLLLRKKQAVGWFLILPGVLFRKDYFLA